MSCLKQNSRIRNSSLFNKIYKQGKQYHRPSFVIFYLKSDVKQFAFISSKKVGNAVKRNRSRRVLRAVINLFCPQLKNGLYILVAKDIILTTDFKTVISDVQRGFKYLRVF